MPAEETVFAKRIRECPVADGAGKGRAAALIERWNKASENHSAASAAIPIAAVRLLEGVFSGSPFLFQVAERDPAYLFETIFKPPEAAFDDVLREADDACKAATQQREIMTALRRGRTRVALIAGFADLAGIWNVDEVTQRLSAVASLFVSNAVDFLLRQAAKAGSYIPVDPAAPASNSGLIVLGMGKLGAGELNYSSDIDLIVFYERGTAALSSLTSEQAFYVRLVRDLVYILQERTGDGYVYRTDLRLRPDPASTQAAISTSAAFHYYETQGQNWERAAFIKARPIAGDINAGNAFLTSLQPYVWRKYLDYNAIADIHAMKRQIHAAKGHTEIAVAGHNIKLGRGGIREIEFFAQCQQLIGGGRQPQLRTAKTLEALDVLRKFDWIDETAKVELSGAYRFLRRIEHRLQMIADRQTHTLPSTPSELEAFSRFCGYESVSDFEGDLRRHMYAVRDHYAALFEDAPGVSSAGAMGNLVFTGDSDDPETLETLARLGFQNPSSAIALIKGWHYGRYRSMRSERAREILTGFTPALLEAFGESAAPDRALSTFDRFLSALPAAVQLFSLLQANPNLLHLISQIMGSAPRLAGLIVKRPHLLDAILDPTLLSTITSRNDMRDFLDRELSAAGVYENRLNRARALGQEQMFYIGVSLLSGQSTPAAAAASYALLAEASVAALLFSVQQEFGLDFPAPVVVAMGKLGGREMTASSDLDLIVVYDCASPGASVHYTRFTQRLIAALSAPTAEGTLYPVDMRLRPSGKAGPLAVGLDGFLAYQKEQAWTWEHLALTRARAVAGPAGLREKLEAGIRDVLLMPRDRLATARNVREMRALIAKEKGRDDLWDTRHHDGGLVDIEFIAQFLQIANAHDHPYILDSNTRAGLRRAMDRGVLAHNDGGALLDALDLYDTISQILRVCVEGRFDPATAPRDLVRLLLQMTAEPSLSSLEAKLAESYKQVATAFTRLII